MSRTEATKHVVEIVAAVSVVAATGLGFVAQNAASASADAKVRAAEAAVVATQTEEVNEELSAKAARLEQENEGLLAQVKDLQQQLGAQSPGLVNTAPAASVGDVLYAGRNVRVTGVAQCGDVYAARLYLNDGSIEVGGYGRGDDDYVMFGGSGCDASLSARYSTKLSFEIGEVGTLETCLEAVKSAPVRGMEEDKLRAGQNFCAAAEDAVTHVRIVSVNKNGDFVLKITGWSTGTA